MRDGSRNGGKRRSATCVSSLEAPLQLPYLSSEAESRLDLMSAGSEKLRTERSSCVHSALWSDVTDRTKPLVPHDCGLTVQMKTMPL